MNVDQIKQKIEANLPGAVANVYSSDGHHFDAEVIYSGFANKSLIEQHRMVYQAIGDSVGNAIHALSLSTKVK